LGLANKPGRQLLIAPMHLYHLNKGAVRAATFRFSPTRARKQLVFVAHLLFFVYLVQGLIVRLPKLRTRRTICASPRGHSLGGKEDEEGKNPRARKTAASARRAYATGNAFSTKIGEASR
jgi:hypothetical protein